MNRTKFFNGGHNGVCGLCEKRKWVGDCAICWNAEWCIACFERVGASWYEYKKCICHYKRENDEWIDYSVCGETDDEPNACLCKCDEKQDYWICGYD